MITWMAWVVVVVVVVVADLGWVVDPILLHLTIGQAILIHMVMVVAAPDLVWAILPMIPIQNECIILNALLLSKPFGLEIIISVAYITHLSPYYICILLPLLLLLSLLFDSIKCILQFSHYFLSFLFFYFCVFNSLSISTMKITMRGARLNKRLELVS
ncbi:hypothetical protein BCR42DRAFT_405459 [Absidia repens]|uniref:Uncharacterized protein n=1 Tax=Absidia repens TaxID=90262 RepID=A0A1X2ITE7_9FUNG|nr:hypothetical protein BCR42DRAFT_405459 [Absidia repens]